MTFYFPKMMFCNALPAADRRPKGIFRLFRRIPADDFSSASYTQGDVSVRSSLNFALGWIILALQAEKNIHALSPPRQPHFCQLIENRVFSEHERLFGNIAVKNDLIAK